MRKWHHGRSRDRPMASSKRRLIKGTVYRTPSLKVLNCADNFLNMISSDKPDASGNVEWGYESMAMAF